MVVQIREWLYRLDDRCTDYRMVVQIRGWLYRLEESCTGVLDSKRQSETLFDNKPHTMRTMNQADNHSFTYVHTYNHRHSKLCNVV